MAAASLSSFGCGRNVPPGQDLIQGGGGQGWALILKGYHSEIEHLVL